MEEEKKTQEYHVSEDFEVEDSSALRVLKAKGEENDNPYESNIPQKKVSKLENFWYLHKWHLGIGIFAAVIVIILLCQLIFNIPADVYIMYTGPQPIIGNDYENLEDAFEAAMDDYNGDGHKEISFTDNTFLTTAEIERRQKEALAIKEKDPDYPAYTYDATSNNAAYQRFMAEVTSGSHMFCMLDPDLYLGLREQGGFVPLSDIFENVPEGEDEYGIRLGNTDFYKSNPKLRFLPPNTMIAVRLPSTLDTKSGDRKHEMLEAHKKLLRAIYEYSPEE